MAGPSEEGDFWTAGYVNVRDEAEGVQRRTFLKRAELIQDPQFPYDEVIISESILLNNFNVI
jgi:hypothetical protein